MNLETRAVSFEDIARQVLTSDVKREPDYWVDQIGKSYSVFKIINSNYVFFYLLYP